MDLRNDVLAGGPGSEHRRHPLGPKKLCIIRGNNPAHENGFIDFALLKNFLNRRDQRHMRAGKNRKADDINVLLDCGLHHHLRRLMKPRVDDFEARITQRPRHNFGATIVTIQTRLSNENAIRTLHSSRI